MKRVIAGILIITAFIVGRMTGIEHAMTDSEVWLAEYEEPADGNGDWLINITLDGKTRQNVIWFY